MGGELTSFVAVTGLVMVVPGPSVLFAVTHRLRGGVRAGLWAVLGLESGLALHVVAACVGISGAVAASPAVLTALQGLGAAYLAVLGARMLRPGAAGPVAGDAGAGGSGAAYAIFRDGVMVDLLNPKTVLYFVALLPQFVDPTAGSMAHQSARLGACVVLIAVLCDGGYAVLAGRVQRRLALAEAAGRSPFLSTERLAGLGQRASGCAFLALAAVAVLA